MHNFNVSFAYHFYILILTSWIWTHPSTKKLKFESPSKWNLYEGFNLDEHGLTRGHQNRNFDHVWEWMWMRDGNLHVLKWILYDGTVQDWSPHMKFILNGYQIWGFSVEGLSSNPRCQSNILSSNFFGLESLNFKLWLVVSWQLLSKLWCLELVITESEGS